MASHLWHNIHVKRISVILVLLILGTLSVSSCIPSSLSCSSGPESTPVYTGPCMADFYADTTSLDRPGYVNFFSTSVGNIKTLRWNFGNGYTGVGPHAATYYNNNGYYTVTLTIEGPDCYDTETKEEYIEMSGC